MPCETAARIEFVVECALVDSDGRHSDTVLCAVLAAVGEVVERTRIVGVSYIAARKAHGAAHLAPYGPHEARTGEIVHLSDERRGRSLVEQHLVVKELLTLEHTVELKK